MSKWHKKFNRFTIILLVCVLVFPYGIMIRPNKAEAVPVFDAIGAAIASATRLLTEQTIGGTSPLYTGLATAGREIIKQTLRRMTQSVVTWIEGGFNGNPGFITNPEDFLRDTADIIIGDFLINNKALDFLCDPFKINVKLAIGLQYQPFTENIRCRLTDALANVEGAYDDFVNGDFIGGGGWDSWLQITTVPQNNQMGAMILAQTELDARITGSKEAELAKGAWSGGFLSWEKCTDRETGETNHGNLGAIQTSYSAGGRARSSGAETIDPVTGQSVNPDSVYDDTVVDPITGERSSVSPDSYNAPKVKGPSNTICEIQTPGKEIVDQLGWAKSSTVRELEISNDLDAIFNALSMMVIKYGVDYFSSAISGDNMNNSDPAAAYNAYLNTLQQTQQRQGNYGGGVSGGGSSSGGVNYNANGTTDFNQNFVNTTAALTAVDGQLALEQQFITIQGNIFELLEETRTIFNSSSCSTAVKTEVNEQITGDFVGTKSLPWNETDTALAIETASSNISALESARDKIESATSQSQISSAVSPLNSLNLTSTTAVATYSVGGTFYNQIKNWVVSKVNTYGSSCNLDTDGLSEWGIE